MTNSVNEVTGHDGLAGSVAVVTGAAGGIGRAIVASLARRGAIVVALDCDEVRLGTVLTETAALGTVVGYAVDVTAASGLDPIIERIEREIGPIAVLVNAAGVMRTAPILDLDEKDWAAVFAVNTMAVVSLSRRVAALMVPRRTGCIVTVASNAASVPRTQMAAYCASKAASTMFTRCLGLELAAFGIRCNVVSPGSTETPMLHALWHDESGRAATLHGSPQDYRLGIPLGRIAAPEDIADAVTFLASAQARHITMHDLRVDGGATLDG
jgi:2,3-dihydro-2,3-dihydroxybenzoate dehydrogenase